MMVTSLVADVAPRTGKIITHPLTVYEGITGESWLT